MSLKSKNNDTYRVLALSDPQVYWHKGKIAGVDMKLVNSVVKYIEDEQFDEFIHLGDHMDFNCISTHNKTKLRNLEAKRIEKDYEAGNEVLDIFQEAFLKKNKETKFVLIEGNHDWRVESYINEHPVVEGMLEVEKGLNLKDRGFKWVRFWDEGELYKRGKALFIHGRYTNKYHSEKHPRMYGANIFYGHTHDIQSYSMEQWGKNKVIMGQSIGCTCVEQDYMMGRPDNWQQGFVVIDFFPNGMFNHFMVRVHNGRFVAPNGKIYKP